MPKDSDPERLKALTEAYDERVHAVRKSLEDFGRAYWATWDHYRDSALRDMLDGILPRVRAGQLATAELTRAYLREYAQELGWKFNIPPIDADEVTFQRGVDPREVYARPFVTARATIAEGKGLQAAAKAGELRLLQLIGGDMQMAKRAQARSSMKAMGAKGYRRVLTGRENCALCVIASTQRYWVEDLLPIHPGCDCNVAPLPKGIDPSEQVIDEDTLEAAHAAIQEELGISDRSARAPDYGQMLLTTEHGEYGPVIQWRETRDERRARISRPKKKGKASDSRSAPKGVHVTLSDIESGRVTNEVLKEGIRPYVSLKEVPRHAPSHISEEQKLVNMRWGTRIPRMVQRTFGVSVDAYDVNCARCTTALELRIRGYDVVAGAGQWDPPGDWRRYMSESWVRPDGTHPEWVGGLGNRELVTHLFETEPEGARGFMFVAWEEGEGTHILNWERSQGKLRFYDSQVIRGFPENERHRQANWVQIEGDAREGESMYIRIDDCEPTDRVLNTVSVEVK